MCFAWQGIKLSLPADWNPQKLEGDFRAGLALLSDLQGPRLGLRWKHSAADSDPRQRLREAMVGEVGELATKEAVEIKAKSFGEALAYFDPDPPGRDVLIGFSETSGRLIELTLHRQPGEAKKLADIAESLVDSAQDAELAWSVFDLSCTTPAGWSLSGKALNAGDLSLSFVNAKDTLTIRQLALARLALKRQPIERWLEDLQQPHGGRYRSVNGKSDVAWKGFDGQELKGVVSCVALKTMLRWAWTLPKQWAYAVLHDESRDRLILAQSTDAAAMETVCRSVGLKN